MSIERLATLVRDHYLKQFEAFLTLQRAGCGIGAAEVKFDLLTKTSAFRRKAIVDFVRNDEGVEAIHFEPGFTLSFEPWRGWVGKAEILIEELRWDAVVIRHDGSAVQDTIAEWFERWFDPNDRYHDPTAAISGCIHALFIEDDKLQVDLGTAPTEALIQLLSCLEKAGARRLQVSATAAAPRTG